MDIKSDARQRRRFPTAAFRALLFALLVSFLPLHARAFPPDSAPQQEQIPPAASDKVENYSLPPEIRRKAVEYSRTRYEIYFLSVALSLAIYFLAWRGGFGVLLRDRARR
ncbi:MAG: hypothetical protein ACM3NO_11035, partial [Deltaproteobacteria bacterium]